LRITGAPPPYDFCTALRVMLAMLVSSRLSA
jgi:hypothetical protein